MSYFFSPLETQINNFRNHMFNLVWNNTLRIEYIWILVSDYRIQYTAKFFKFDVSKSGFYLNMQPSNSTAISIIEYSFEILNYIKKALNRYLSYIWSWSIVLSPFYFIIIWNYLHCMLYMIVWGPSWPWSYGSCIYNYLCNKMNYKFWRSNYKKISQYTRISFNI